MTKEIAESFVGLSFKKKLLIIPIIISNNKFMFKKNHKIIIILNELITKRNKILHNKSYFRQLNIDSDGTFRFEEDLVTLIEKQKSLAFGEALKIFHADFVIPASTNSLIENDL